MLCSGLEFEESAGGELKYPLLNSRATQGRWRQATRAVMMLPSLHGLPVAQITDLLDCPHRAPLDQSIQRRRAGRTEGMSTGQPD
jgi:hypothetical protein